jgi:hypothetical protein
MPLFLKSGKIFALSQFRRRYFSQMTLAYCGQPLECSLLWETFIRFVKYARGRRGLLASYMLAKVIGPIRADINWRIAIDCALRYRDDVRSGAALFICLPQVLKNIVQQYVSDRHQPIHVKMYITLKSSSSIQYFEPPMHQLPLCWCRSCAFGDHCRAKHILEQIRWATKNSLG